MQVHKITINRRTSLPQFLNEKKKTFIPLPNRLMIKYIKIVQRNKRLNKLKHKPDSKYLDIECCVEKIYVYTRIM